MIEQILEDRQEKYGDAAENFALIGRLWGAILATDDLAPEEVAVMMIALKSVRILKNPTYSDSWDDIVGYVTVGREIVGA
jgi:Domain of unknown function (DUF6378)